MKRFNREDVLCVAAMFILIIWVLINFVDVVVNPPSIYDMTVEERIRYERMIFP